MRFRKIASVVLVITALVAISPASARQADKVSRPGEYSGYSEPLYEDWVRSSLYVPVRDGTRLAVDIYRPAVNGQPVDDPLPVLWTHHRYHRANVQANGEVTGILDQAPELARVIAYGYVIAAVDVRGGGASYGTRQGEFTREEAFDAYDITEWFAAQPWSDGNIGMYGISYLGITQYMAASTKPPHLKAIFPQMAMFDMYDFVYPGGVFRRDFILSWGAMTTLLDKTSPAAPVDDDPEGVLLGEAVRQHAANQNIYTLALTQPFRDSSSEAGMKLHYEWSPSTYINDINDSGVAIYHLGGWYDMYPRDALLWFNNLTIPQKLVLTPWSHNGSGKFDLLAEHLRWFDYWLKGIDNGIMDEAPITYYVMGASGKTAWRTATQWPLPETQPTAYYFQPSNLLSLETPAEAGQDDYTIDYTTTTGRSTRWSNGYGGDFHYPNMAANDEKGLAYTSEPLTADLEVTGHPVIHLWVTNTTDDADFYVYLEEVNQNGVSLYITEGVQRASHRATTDAPYNMMGLPYHRSFEEDIAPLPAGEPVELVFDLYPTSNVFDSGNRIRVTITGADADNYEVLTLDPPPTVSIYRSAEYASYIELPVIP